MNSTRINQSTSNSIGYKKCTLNDYWFSLNIWLIQIVNTSPGDQSTIILGKILHKMIFTPALETNIIYSVVWVVVMLPPIVSTHRIKIRNSTCCWGSRIYSESFINMTLYQLLPFQMIRNLGTTNLPEPGCKKFLR